MIEAIMYLGLGFLAASLLALATMPLIHARAVRLTIRRLEAATPLSMAEIQADKDQLRAEFAMSTRRLEVSVEQLKAKTTSQLAELGKKTDAINRLKRELGEQRVAIVALEAHDKALKEQLHATEDELVAKTNALYETERVVADKQAQFAKLTADVTSRGASSGGQGVEILSLRTQVESLKAQITDREREVQEAEKRLAQERRDAAAAASELAVERGQVRRLGERIAQLERQGGATDELVARNALLESQLDRAREERTKLQQELAAMTRGAEAAWAAERVENAVLRERINDVAAEVVRLTSVLEGPDSPIETILAQDAARLRTNGATPGASSAQGEEGSLADRIRALQTRASRLSSA